MRTRLDSVLLVSHWDVSHDKHSCPSISSLHPLAPYHVSKPVSEQIPPLTTLSLHFVYTVYLITFVCTLVYELRGTFFFLFLNPPPSFTTTFYTTCVIFIPYKMTHTLIEQDQCCSGITLCTSHGLRNVKSRAYISLSLVQNQLHIQGMMYNQSILIQISFLLLYTGFP